jgi:hypothetical protein
MPCITRFPTALTALQGVQVGEVVQDTGQGVAVHHPIPTHCRAPVPATCCQVHHNPAAKAHPVADLSRARVYGASMKCLASLLPAALHALKQASTM